MPSPGPRAPRPQCLLALQGMRLTRETLLMKLGAARQQTPSPAWIPRSMAEVTDRRIAFRLWCRFWVPQGREGAGVPW